MKATILSFALLGTGLSFAQSTTVKPGTIATVNLKVTVTTENPVIVQNLSGGAKRKLYKTTATKLLSRDILESMRTANLLDGTLKGWSLSRLADLTDKGNLYATKNGKTAVAVPATLLTQPTVQSGALSGTLTVPASGPQSGKLDQLVYSTFTVKGAPATAGGTLRLTSSQVKVNNQNTAVTLRTESYSLVGKGTTATSVISGTYGSSQSVAVNLISLLPGNAVP